MLVVGRTVADDLAAISCAICWVRLCIWAWSWAMSEALEVDCAETVEVEAETKDVNNIKNKKILILIVFVL